MKRRTRWPPSRNITAGRTDHDRDIATVTAAAYNAKKVASGANATSTGSGHGTGSNASGSGSGSGSGTTGAAHNSGQSTFSLPPLHIYVGFYILVSLVWL